MVERLSINRDTGVFSENPVFEGAGKDCQINTESTWLSKKITVVDAKGTKVGLNSGSLIDFLQTVPEGRELRKGFLGINRSEDLQIQKVFKAYIERVTSDIEKFQVIEPGLNILAKCKTDDCNIKGREFVSKIGFNENDKFNVGVLASNINCPCCNNTDVDSLGIILSDCSYTFDGIPNNLREKVSGGHFELNGQEGLPVGWATLEIDVKPLKPGKSEFETSQAAFDAKMRQLEPSKAIDLSTDRENEKVKIGVGFITGGYLIFEQKLGETVEDVKKKIYSFLKLSREDDALGDFLFEGQTLENCATLLSSGISENVFIFQADPNPPERRDNRGLSMQSILPEIKEVDALQKTAPIYSLNKELIDQERKIPYSFDEVMDIAEKAFKVSPDVRFSDEVKFNFLLQLKNKLHRCNYQEVVDNQELDVYDGLMAPCLMESEDVYTRLPRKNIIPGSDNDRSHQIKLAVLDFIELLPGVNLDPYRKTMINQGDPLSYDKVIEKAEMEFERDPNKDAILKRLKEKLESCRYQSSINSETPPYLNSDGYSASYARFRDFARFRGFGDENERKVDEIVHTFLQKLPGVDRAPYVGQILK